MNFLRSLFQKHDTSKVFTPTRSAKLSYIKRPELETKIESCLQNNGRQLVLYGVSGSGKTTIIRHILSSSQKNKRFIYTICESKTTLESLLLSAFDKLNKYYISSSNSKTAIKVSNDLKTEITKLGASIGSSISQENGFTQTRILPPQLTPQKLAEYLGELKLVWIIEDFHKVEDNEKKKIADILKIFIDVANDYEEVRIICIGANGSAKELIDIDSNLYPRVAQINIPLLTDEEIYKIIERGESLLRIKMSPKLKDKIVHYSCNVASIAHQMCFDICNANGIKKNQLVIKEIGESSFKDAVNAYVTTNSDSFKSVYEEIVRDQRSWYILRTLSEADERGMSFDTLYDKYLRSRPQKSIPKKEAFDQLRSLSNCETSIIKYNPNSDKFYISTPFWQAFVRMQQAMEAVQSKKQKNKRKLDLTLKSQEDLDAIVYDRMLKLLEQFKSNS